MAIEKFIRGKRDACAHDGLASNRRRLASAEYHQAHWQEESEPIEEVDLVSPGQMHEMRRGVTYLLSQTGLLHGMRSEKLNENNNLSIQTSQDSQHSRRSGGESEKAAS